MLTPIYNPESWQGVLNTADAAGAENRTVVLAVSAVIGPDAIHCAYIDAARLIAVAANSPRPPGVVTPPDLDVHEAMGSMPPDGLESLVGQIVRPFDVLPDEECDGLVKTVRVYYAEDCNVARTAGALGKTRKTVNDRIDKIERLTGLSPKRAGHRLRFELALHHPALVSRGQ